MTDRFNGTLSATNYGAKRVTIEKVTYAVEFIADQDQTRMGRAYYAKQMTAAPFQIAIVCASHGEAQVLADWFKGYGDRAASGHAQVGSMRVTVPSRQFDKMGVPSTGIVFGDDRTSVLYRMNISFAGTGDPIGGLGLVDTTAKGVSTFSMPEDESKILPHFYPGGVQLSGDDMGEDLLYDRGTLTPEEVQRQIDLADTDNAVFAQNRGTQ